MKIATQKRQAVHGNSIPGSLCVLIFLASAVFCRLSSPEFRIMAASQPNYSADVAPILQKHCSTCHSSSTHKSGLVMDSYSSLIKGGKHGQSIVPHDAKDSRLLQMLEGEVDPQMPLEADPLAASEIAVIRTWVDAGAPGPAPKEAPRTAFTPGIPELKPQVKVISPLTAVKFSPDGKLLAVGGYKEVRLIEPATGTVLSTLSGHADFVRSIAFSPDGTMLAAAGGEPQNEGEIRIWNVPSFQLLKTLHGHKDSIYSVAWSSDGRLIASGSYDRMVKLWNASTGEELRTLQDHIDAVFAVAFTPDGKRLASASQDRTVKIWNVASGKRLFTLSDALDGLTSVAFSPSGDEIAAGGYDKTIYIWHVNEEDGHLSRSLIADEDSLLALAWSPDGKTIVTASSDASIRLRDAATLDPVRVLDKQSDWVEAIDLSSDGKWLAAGRYDGTLSLYDGRTSVELRAPTLVFDQRQTAGDKQAKEVARK